MWTQGLPPRDGELYLISFNSANADERCYTCARWIDATWRVGRTQKGLVINVIEDRITHWHALERVVATPYVPRRRFRREPEMHGEHHG